MARTRKTFKRYNVAKAYVRKLGLKTMQDWIAFSKGIHSSGQKRPEDIPSNPWTVYKGVLEGMGKKFSINEFIGSSRPQRVMAKRASTKTVKRGRPVKKVLTPEQIVPKRGRPRKIEALPTTAPKRGRPRKKINTVMEAMHDVIETKTESPSMLSYSKAKAFLKRMHVKTRADFNALVRMKILPKGFPNEPSVVYKQQWNGWNNFLGQS